MTNPRILAFAGSLRAESINKKLTRIVADAVRTAGGDVNVIDLRDFPLPLYDGDIEAASGIPENGKKLKQMFIESQGLLIASPEYGHSLPGSLKNAIDWLIGSGELESKIIGVTASTPSVERGRLGLGALCGTLSAVKARVVGGVPITRGPGFDAELQALMDELVDAVRNENEQNE